ncbi:hypothetical protein GCM10009802_39570 [Streptomyces synnematoformans]|uniref:Uncharacterized protein n=1 Tax=Streptomyces synnematoformans TaxID=415721 RepID=A0ABN2YTX4_9ACTN
MRHPGRRREVGEGDPPVAAQRTQALPHRVEHVFRFAVHEPILPEPQESVPDRDGSGKTERVRVNRVNPVNPVNPVNRVKEP